MEINEQSSREIRESILAVFYEQGIVDIKTFISADMDEEEKRNVVFAYGHAQMLWLYRNDEHIIAEIPIELLPAFLTEQFNLLAKYVMMGLR